MRNIIPFKMKKSQGLNIMVLEDKLNLIQILHQLQQKHPVVDY